MNIKSFEKINNVHYIDEEVQVKRLLKFEVEVGQNSENVEKSSQITKGL